MDKVKTTIAKAIQKQEKHTNKHWRYITFKEGQYVLLKFEKKRIKTNAQVKLKLSFRYFGPFQIIKKLSDVVYKLKLLDNWKIHDVFHINVLKEYKGQIPNSITQQEPPKIIDNEEIVVPETILMHKEKELRGRLIKRYLLKFKNYPATEATWVDEAFFKDFPSILQVYEAS